MSLNFRKAEKKDIEQLVQLMDQLGYVVDATTLKENLKSSDQSVYIAELDGKVVGCLAFHFLRPFHSDEKHMRIVSLVVDKGQRKKGIGKQLLALAEEKAKDCSLIELTCANHRKEAHDFYCNQGYKCGEKRYFRKRLTG